MRRGAVALFTVAVLASSAQLLAHEGHGHKIMGTVAAVETGHVEIDTKDGEKVSIVVTKETELLRGKTRITAADIANIRSEFEARKRGGQLV